MPSLQNICYIFHNYIIVCTILSYFSVKINIKLSLFNNFFHSSIPMFILPLITIRFNNQFFCPNCNSAATIFFPSISITVNTALIGGSICRHCSITFFWSCCTSSMPVIPSSLFSSMPKVMIPPSS